ncbi:MAG: biotin/lipoyl-binding protein, partial [Deinococcus-Thermus bacterium]
MTELKLPDLGDNVASAVVVGVLIKEGDKVTEGQPVLELETDKAVMEAPASASGTVSKVLVKPGDEVKSGQAIAVLAGEGEPPKDEAPAQKETKQPARAQEDKPAPPPARPPSPPQASPACAP